MPGLLLGYRCSGLNVLATSTDSISLGRSRMADQIVITEKTARQKTSAPPLVLATERSCRLKATCSISSNLRMLCRPGSTGSRYFFDRKLFTALAPQKVETKPPSSKPFARPFGPARGRIANGETPTEATAAIWITNQGLEGSSNTVLSFEELLSLLKWVRKWPTVFQDYDDQPARPERDSQSTLEARAVLNGLVARLLRRASPSLVLRERPVLALPGSGKTKTHPCRGSANRILSYRPVD